MSTRVECRRTAVFVFGLTLLLLAAGCGQDDDAVPTDTVPPPTDEPAVELPAELTEPETPPNPAVFLPPLEDYATEDRPEPGELEASLDHGSVPYVDVRRRLVLDEQAFAAGEVTVVTVEPDSAGGEAYLDHRYGDAPRRPVELAGVEMMRVEAEPFDAVAWTGPTFAVTFERGQEQSHEWLEDLARATVEAIAEE